MPDPGCPFSRHYFIAFVSVGPRSCHAISVISPSVTIFGKGMLLVMDKAVEKIIKSEFVEMKDVILEIILSLLEKG